MLAIVVGLACFGFAATANAGKTLSLVCFPNDHPRYCAGIFLSHHRINLRLGSFSFKGHYHLCVRDPDRDTTCRVFKLSRFCNCSIKDWKRNFPHALPGVYHVQWKRKGHRLTPQMHFTKPPPPSGA